MARGIGYPLVVKASAGGGGRGIRFVHSEGELLETIEMARGEAASVFGDPTVYLERFVQHARHVEVQVLGDGTNFIHLGDRDCSMQRRSQKVIEEAPAPDLPDARPPEDPGILRGTGPRVRLQRRRNGRIPL